MPASGEVYRDPRCSAAVDYRGRGWNPIPLKIRSKQPKLPKGHPYLSRKATDEEFARFDFRHNVGLVTGKMGAFIVLDDDDEGSALRESGWHVPFTPTVKTERGYQYYFDCPDAGFPTFDVAENPEVKGDGAYVVAPPSIHPSGAGYEWVIAPDEAELAEVPEPQGPPPEPKTPVTMLSNAAFERRLRGAATEAKARALRNTLDEEITPLSVWHRGLVAHEAEPADVLLARHRLKTAKTRYTAAAFRWAEFVSEADEQREHPVERSVADAGAEETARKAAEERRKMEKHLANEAKRQRVEEAGESA